MNKNIISGWGLTNPVSVKQNFPKSIDELENLINSAKPKTIITRGLGRSYGDAAQLKEASVIQMDNFNTINLDVENHEVTTGSGVSFDQLLKFIIPKGFFVPVSPGTRYVTVGGAISSDVHGKNHHVDGSFGNHVKSFLILNGNGEIKRLNKFSTNDIDRQQFWATIGGMGLTGVIIEATFELIPIETSFINLFTRNFENIELLIDAMIEADQKFRYSVAWIDSLHPNLRGILSCGDHARQSELERFNKRHKLSKIQDNQAQAPKLFPRGLMNNLTIRIFNEGWYRKSVNSKQNDIETIGKFFYPLDAIKNWNRVYGSDGFIQYQFAIPDKEVGLIIDILKILRANKVPNFLPVLKRFGDFKNGPLSFPLKGWTLATDIPANYEIAKRILDEFDEKIIRAGGRIYLAKDVRQKEKTFKKSYERYEEWREIKNQMDERNIFYSSLAERLGL